ncbi:MAG: cation-translocating P-type ATPase [Pseudomonadota bacterium]
MDNHGLSRQEAAARLKAEGANELPVAGRRTPWKIIIGVITEPMFALLLGAGFIYLLLGDLLEALVLLCFAMLSVLITVVQEIRSERVLDALRDLTSPRALVVRDGQPVRIAGREVVRGDLLILNEGDRIPADAIVVSGNDILTDESLLTGESVAVRKKPSQNAATAPGRPGGDDLPAVYAGTLIVRGNGRAVVVATGVRSEIGKIGQALSTIETEQPRLREQTRHIVRVFATGALVLSTALVLINGLLHGNWLSAFLGGIALGMSLLPEEFPLVLSVFMVMGAWRISKARVLTRRAAAIETLGSATVLCTDKTGTLTQNKMSIVRLQREDVSWNAGASAPIPPALAEIVATGVMACPKDSYDPMDMAFATALAEKQAPEKAEPVRHYGLGAGLLVMANVHDIDGRYSVAAKGAPEAIGKICRFDAAQMDKLHKAVADMAAHGLRVLGVAKAVTAGDGSLPETPEGFHFEFLGLAGFADPLRPAVPDSVREARAAGIRVIMITGDYPATAKTIAEQAGITAEKVVTGEALEKMTEDALRLAVKETSVFARIMPEQKLRIVNALKAAGEVVAMTGDGVNDAPSLKAAHIGIAMGSRGTDVAREASSIVLLDDDFSSLVGTIRLGRRIYDNLRKAFLYIIAVHVPIAGLALIPAALGKPLILTPLLIALLEMIIDPTCSIVLEAEREEKDVMSRPPRDPNARILTARILGLGVTQGALALVLAVGVWIFAQKRGLPEAEVRSLVFATLVMISLALVLASRSFSTSLVSAFRRPNPVLWKVMAAVAGILGVLMFWPPAQTLFRFGPLHGFDVMIAVLSGALLLAALEIVKSFWRGRV